MPQNKNALLRYRILDQCFSNPYCRYTVDELKDYLNEKLYKQEGLPGISIRTLREDMRTMRQIYEAPIKAKTFNGHKCYYAYDKEDFSIFKSGLSDEDYKVLKATIDMLGKYKSSNIWLEDVITNLECRFGIVANTEKLVFFDECAELKGLNFLSSIISHTINHEAIDLVYRSYRGKEREYLFSPYCVKQYNRRWFMFGYDARSGQNFNFALDDRVQSFKKSDRPFVKNTTLNIDEYFKDIIGVTLDGKEVLDVQLKFTPTRLHYVLSKPIHPSQRLVDEKECIVGMRVKKNKELKQVIYSYMPEVEVLSPLSLREEIRAEIEQNLNKYR